MQIRWNRPGAIGLRESGKTKKALAKNLEKLSSGLRINRAADDAAGLSSSEKMRAKITELNRCQSNVLEGEDLARTADGALAEVNDMLRRARLLCIEAANGTYSEQELASISDEMNELFGEIDRITAASCHNTIRLFRGKVEQAYDEVIVENFDPLPEGELATWGTMDFVQSADFDRAQPAQPATASFQLDSSINPNDVSTLEGKSIRIGSNTYYFTNNTSAAPSGTTAISLGGRTVEQALQAIAASSADVSKVELDAATGTVTLTAALSDLSYTVTADGKTIGNTAKQGDGESRNGIPVLNPGGDRPLLQVDGLGVTNNRPVYETTASTSFSIPLINGTITADQVADFKRNTLVLNGWMNSNSYINKTINLSGVNVTAGMTKQQVGEAVANAISSQSGPLGLSYTAAYNTSTGAIDITAQQSSPTGPLRLSISENIDSPSSTTESKRLWSSSPLGVTTTSTPATSLESGAKYEITIPSSPSVPFSFQIGSSYYLYYDSSAQSFTEGDYNYTSFSPVTPTRIDVKNIGDLQGDITRRVETYVRGLANADKGSISVAGGKVTYTSNVGTTASPSISGVTINVSAYKIVPGSGTSSKRVLNNAAANFQQTATASFDLGADVGALAGKGFSVNGQKLEFTNGPGVNGSYRDVDISGCATMADVVQQVQGQLGSAYTVALNGSKMEISIRRNSEYQVSVTDGEEGLISADAGAVAFSGGTNVGHSQKVLDFSSIHEDNLDSLLGKGFRINCATCEGEYINVIFCWENDGKVPPTFSRLDPTTGETRTIHNIPVELSKVRSGDKIVESIVEQVRPNLDHYTDVAIGDPATTLVAMDKRLGDVTDLSGKWYPGRVQTGLEANFTYSVSVSREPVLPPDGEVQLQTDNVKIYAGSDPEPQYIVVHLPYIDLQWLRLNPPTLVDLNAEDQDPSDWLARVDRANIAISDARGTIGADYNRLEHAWQDLSQADVQLSDAESRLRDTDVAQMMMEHTKLQILTQSQHSMLAQANIQAQQVLELLR